MLILLSDRFQGRLATLAGEPGFLDAVNNLALGHSFGKHIVSGPTPVVKELIGVLSGNVQGMWREIRKRHFALGALREHVTHLCIVEPEREGGVRKEELGDQVRFHVPYGFFEDFGRLTEARLVAENPHDATVYLTATRGYLFSCREVRGLQLALQRYGGGGQNMAGAVRDHAAHGFTLGIADSDRKWPEAQEGETLKAVRKVISELSGKCVIELFALPCHEIENLLPAKLVLDALGPKDVDLQARCLVAEQMGLLGATEPVYHLDLKEGLRWRDVHDAATNLEKYRFLGQVFEAHRARARRPDGGFCDEEPACTERKACRCVLFEGFAILENVAAHCEKGLSPQKSAEYFFAEHLPCAPVWQAICRHLLFACAYARRRL